MSPPFTEGDLVTIKGQVDLEVYEIKSCEWVESECPGIEPRWVCYCISPPGFYDGAFGWAGPASGLSHAVVGL